MYVYQTVYNPNLNLCYSRYNPVCLTSLTAHLLVKIKVVSGVLFIDYGNENPRLQHGNPSDRATILGIDLEPPKTFIHTTACSLFCISSISADLAAGRQERKHREHALPIAFKH